MDNLKTHSAVFLGDSIGGATAVRRAYMHPNRVQALVLCDSGGCNLLAQLPVSSWVRLSSSLLQDEEGPRRISGFSANTTNRS